ncbi:MAG: PRC-barrel domain-containing protein [Actinomycetota bacterium]|jgi:hypothetical protein|nr:PRC-barrel domain-containing protein [Actinomycetota bacterium]
MEEQGLVGLEARSADGTEVLGRISEVVTDEETGEITHVLVEGDGGDQTEVPISEVTLDPEANFATFGADASDEEPGDHVDDDVEPQGYAPNQSDVDDKAHDGQFVTSPTDEHEAADPTQVASTEAGEASGWEDEGSTTPESGYPRNDAYIDPETGDEETDPALRDNETLQDDVEDLVNGTQLGVRAVKEGVVELTGRAATRDDLDESVAEIMGLDGILDVDTTDVDVG